MAMSYVSVSQVADQHKVVPIIAPEARCYYCKNEFHASNSAVFVSIGLNVHGICVLGNIYLHPECFTGMAGDDCMDVLKAASKVADPEMKK